MKETHLQTASGFASPFGATKHEDGVNFAIFSQHATNVQLEFFQDPADLEPIQVFTLDPSINRTDDIWHIKIQGISNGQLYAYRVDGPHDLNLGHRFNFNSILLDPCAKALSWISDWSFYEGVSPKCVYIDNDFNWGNDRILNIPWSETIIYETHVRGLSIHPSSGVSHPGTYRGVIEKIPYLKSLGMTAVELMPIQEFNENEPSGVNPITGVKLKNFWGYNPVLFSAVKASYSSNTQNSAQIHEFKEMVLSLHEAGIEVILDMVFNHTAERDETGPTLNYRGIDNSIYYILADNKQKYLDYTGTLNTFNVNHPAIQNHILDSLRYWVTEFHIDGFRFDEAMIFYRDESGRIQGNSPLVDLISNDQVLKKVKLIAEPWDATGETLTGKFGQGQQWSTWNGSYRDDIRAFWRGDDGKLAVFASRICGSSDIYSSSNKLPLNSINYITSHDGFTLNDLVSYQEKHNEENGQFNQDGTNQNFSAHYGYEGKTVDPLIESIRIRQIKNFILTLLVSRGVPMLLGGDEFRRSQNGNNNPYCQDNEISWYNWSLLEDNQEIFDFTQSMIAFRKAHPILSENKFYSDSNLKWFNSMGTSPHWTDPLEKKIACLIKESETVWLYLIFNADEHDDDFVLPTFEGKHTWHLAVDTSKPLLENELGDMNTYFVKSRSSIILLARA